VLCGAWVPYECGPHNCISAIAAHPGCCAPAQSNVDDRHVYSYHAPPRLGHKAPVGGTSGTTCRFACSQQREGSGACRKHRGKACNLACIDKFLTNHTLHATNPTHPKTPQSPRSISTSLDPTIPPTFAHPSTYVASVFYALLNAPNARPGPAS